jgi:hypothetical protein
VKIDNVGAAQGEQAGLNSADIVYVILVEGGLSRYLAIFDSSDAPDEVGPVRSARQTDIPLLAAYGRIGLAYSGAIPGLLPELAVANLENITPDTARDQFTNDGSMPTYINPRKIFPAYRRPPTRSSPKPPARDQPTSTATARSGADGGPSPPTPRRRHIPSTANRWISLRDARGSSWRAK